MTSEGEQKASEAGEAPAKAIKAADVVAPGMNRQYLQLPSPIYVAEWISPTHVLLGAGGGGRRFGMANILVLLSVETEHTAGSAPAMKLDSQAQRAVFSAAAKGSSAAAEANLWKFVAAMDLGDDVPWCTSGYMLWDSDDVAGETDDNVEEQGGSGKGRPCFTFTRKQQQGLSHCVGLLAVSGIRTFTLVGIERVPPSGGSSGGGDGVGFELRRLACIELPNDTMNPDKKPISLVHHAIVVSHDDNGVLLYDLASLIPSDVGDTIREALPLAEWKLPTRVNGLHANRVNLMQAKSSPPATQQQPTAPMASVRAMLYDFVIVAVAAQDKTVRLACFRLRRRYGGVGPTRQVQRHGEAAPDNGTKEDEPKEGTGAPAKGGRGGGTIQAKVRAPLQFHPSNVFTAEDLSLPFKLLTSSLRHVRLFGIEDLAAWPGAVESARRRATNFSLSTSPASTATLPAASLLVTTFDPSSNSTFLVGLTLNAALGSAPGDLWSAAATTSPAKQPADGSPAPSPRGRSEPRQRQSAIPVFTPSLHIVPSPLLKDCITCMCPTHSVPVAVERAEALARNPFGAAIPLRWMVGTVDGLLARIVAVSPAAAAAAASGRPTSAASSSSAPTAGQLTFTQDGPTRPVATPAHLKSTYGPLHKEPITAVAVSSGNDVMSTDLAQNAIISTLPFTLTPAVVRDNGRLGNPTTPQPAVTAQKVLGINTFPTQEELGGNALTHMLIRSLTGKDGRMVPSQLFAVAMVFGSLLFLIVFLLSH